MAKILEMPKLSPTMEEGVLSAWHKKEGDAVAVDDLLAEVETDKATMEFRSFDQTTLLKILVSAGAEVKLGQPVAIVGSPGEDVSALVAQAGVAASGAKETAAPAPAPARACPRTRGSPRRMDRRRRPRRRPPSPSASLRCRTCSSAPRSPESGKPPEADRPPKTVASSRRPMSERWRATRGSTCRELTEAAQAGGSCPRTWTASWRGHRPARAPSLRGRRRERRQAGPHIAGPGAGQLERRWAGGPTPHADARARSRAGSPSPRRPFPTSICRSTSTSLSS